MTPSAAETTGIDVDPTEAPEPAAAPEAAAGPAAEPSAELPSEEPVRIEQDGRLVVAWLDDQAAFEAIRDSLGRRLPALSGPSRRRVRLELGDRPLDAFDVRRWMHHLSDHCSSDVVGVRCSEAALLAFASASLKVPLDFVPADEELELDPEPEAPRHAAEDADTEAHAAAPDAPTEPGVSTAALVDPSPASEDAEESELEAPAEPTSQAEALDDAGGDDAEPPEDPVPTEAVRLSSEPPSPLDRIQKVIGAVKTAVRGEEPEVAPPEPAPARRPQAPERLENAEGGRKVVVVDRTLRSGASIKSPGDIVVYGDVNAGAELTAEGHIVVLGRLRGLAHAGSGGNEAAQVIAFDLQPPQLRIAHRIAYAPAPGKARRAATWTPEVARIDGDRIVFENFRRR